jgi:hypothetical protein
MDRKQISGLVLKGLVVVIKREEVTRSLDINNKGMMMEKAR